MPWEEAQWPAEPGMAEAQTTKRGKHKAGVENAAKNEQGVSCLWDSAIFRLRVFCICHVQ